MKVRLAYGKEGLWIDLPDDLNVKIVEPKFVPGLKDEEAAIRRALREPIASPPLREMVCPSDTVAIVFSDITRPMPNRRVIPIILEELSHVPKENIILINALGTHRPQTRQELEEMLGPKIVSNYNIIQHDCKDKSTLCYLGETSFGHPIWVNKAYMEASVKILTGFIEPHFFAGFSGGPKAVMPGVSGLESILLNHGAKMIDHPKATWGITEGNPIWEEAREVAAKTNPTFLVNVTLNRNKEITGVFVGDVWKAHAKGVEFAKASAMVEVEEAFDIVISSNSGYPLDINLYQAVKGMSAAARVVKGGGSIIIAAECRDGIPDHGEYKNILKMASSPTELLEIIRKPGFLVQDQWEAQIQALVQLKADVYVKSSYLTEKQIKEALLKPCVSIEETLKKLLTKYGRKAKVCVLPEGPQTIPYLKGQL
ncbi:MAG: nickel-dependent lactate racemase [Thermoproteota archaeon]